MPAGSYSFLNFHFNIFAKLLSISYVRNSYLNSVTLTTTTTTILCFFILLMREKLMFEIVFGQLSDRLQLTDRVLLGRNFYH